MASTLKEIFAEPSPMRRDAVEINNEAHVVGSYTDPERQQLQGCASNLLKFVKVADPNGTMTGQTGINNFDTVVETLSIRRA